MRHAPICVRSGSYLAENVSFDVADKVIADLYVGMTKIGRLPKLGHERSDLTDDPVLFYRVHKYFIIYVPGVKPIGIARVLHAARDIASILGKD